MWSEDGFYLWDGLPWPNNEVKDNADSVVGRWDERNIMTKNSSFSRKNLRSFSLPSRLKFQVFQKILLFFDNEQSFKNYFNET